MSVMIELLSGLTGAAAVVPVVWRVARRRPVPLAVAVPSAVDEPPAPAVEPVTPSAPPVRRVPSLAPDDFHTMICEADLPLSISTMAMLLPAEVMALIAAGSPDAVRAVEQALDLTWRQAQSAAWLLQLRMTASGQEGAAPTAGSAPRLAGPAAAYRLEVAWSARRAPRAEAALALEAVETVALAEAIAGAGGEVTAEVRAAQDAAVDASAATDRLLAGRVRPPRLMEKPASKCL